MVLKSSHARYADLRCGTHLVSILVNCRSSYCVMSNFGIGVDSARFGLMCLDNSPAILSAGTTSSDGGDGGATVIGGGIGLPNARRIPPKHVQPLVKFS